jgi:hypothetical protein
MSYLDENSPAIPIERTGKTVSIEGGFTVKQELAKEFAKAMITGFISKHGYVNFNSGDIMTQAFSFATVYIRENNKNHL